VTDLPGIHAAAELAYQRYLDSAQWRRTRSVALMRAGHRCAIDASHRDGLQVFHNTRERLGRELDRDLVVLCGDCRAALLAAANAARVQVAAADQNVVVLRRVATADGSGHEHPSDPDKPAGDRAATLTAWAPVTSLPAPAPPALPPAPAMPRAARQPMRYAPRSHVAGSVPPPATGPTGAVDPKGQGPRSWLRRPRRD
jgi:hypothetical protein